MHIRNPHIKSDNLAKTEFFGLFFNLTCLQDPCDATWFFSCQQKFKLENWSDAKNKNLYDRHNCALEHLPEWGLPWPRWHWCHSRWQCLELFSFSKTTGQIVRCSGENRKTWKITIIDMDLFHSILFMVICSKHLKLSILQGSPRTLRGCIYV